MYKNLIRNYIRTSVANHNHTLTATSVCHYFGMGADEAPLVQKELQNLKECGKLRVLDKSSRYCRNKTREANLYLIMETA